MQPKEILEIYKSISIDKEPPVYAYKITSESEKQNYVSRGALNVLIQHLQTFKRNTRFLNDNRIIEIINSVPKPKFSFKGDDLLEQIVYDANAMFYDFLQEYKKELFKKTPQLTTDQKPQNEIEKPLPPIREIFNPPDFFEKLLGKLLENGFCTLNRATGQYFWEKPKSLLAGLTIQLRDKHRLTNNEKYYQFDIYNNQDLGRLVCQFFNVKYDNKTFQPDRIQDKHKKPFNFITAF